jgi:hypothetical protein
MNKEKIKNIVYMVGKTLGILGLLYVFYKLYQEYTFSSFTEQFISVLHITPLLILVNFLSLVIGIYAWYHMLLSYAKKPFGYVYAYYYFSKTEIAKYLPGNIFHFVGRQALAHKIGITQKQMAKISLLHSLLLLGGTIIATTVFAFLSQKVPLYILTLMVLSSIIIFISLVYMYPSIRTNKKVSLNLYLAFSIALQGTMLGIIVVYQSDTYTWSLFCLSISIYILSWLIGYVTPGASGGLGVREGVFIAITNYMHFDIHADIIIFAVLLVRLINILVDVLMYFSTFILENKIKEL